MKKSLENRLSSDSKKNVESEAHLKVKILDSLDEESLECLIAGESLAIIVKNYYNTTDAIRLYENIKKSNRIEKYTHELVEDNKVVQKYFGVDRIGNPFNSIYNENDNSSLVKEYYDQSKKSISLIRSYTAPAITPIDKLRLELDEIYVHGANIASFQNRKMLAGICRISYSEMSHLSADQPHFDALPEKFCFLDEQFAANIYLEVPKEGGELELWDVPAMSPLSEAPDDWRSELPPSILIKPELGDLIIFNCRRPHAIERFDAGLRITMQTFIGYRKNKGLLIWN